MRYLYRLSAKCYLIKTTWLLKEYLDSLLPILTFFINKSLQIEYFHGEWKLRGQRVGGLKNRFTHQQSWLKREWVLRHTLLCTTIHLLLLVTPLLIRHSYYLPRSRPIDQPHTFTSVFRHSHKSDLFQRSLNFDKHIPSNWVLPWGVEML